MVAGGISGRGSAFAGGSGSDDTVGGAGGDLLALNGGVALCQTPSQRRSLWDKFGDWAGFDGHFGTDGTTSRSFRWGGIGRAVAHAIRHTQVTVTYNGDEVGMDEIVVTARRGYRDFVRIVTELPRSFARGVNCSIQDNVTRPIMAASNWITHTARDPIYGARSIGSGFEQLDAAIARAASIDPIDATQNFVSGRVSAYSAAAGSDGAPGLANALAFDAGYATPLLAGGPGPRGAALSVEDAMLLSLRSGRRPPQGAFVDFAMIDDIAPGFYRTHPGQLRFTQPTASPNFGGGGTIDDLIRDLNNGLTPDQVRGGPLQILMQDGVPFSIDNRRLVGFNAAGVSDIPIEIVSLADPMVAERFVSRFDPIGGEGRFTVIVPRSGRTAAEQLLFEQGLIRRRP